MAPTRTFLLLLLTGSGAAASGRMAARPHATPSRLAGFVHQPPPLTRPTAARPSYQSSWRVAAPPSTVRVMTAPPSPLLLPPRGLTVRRISPALLRDIGGAAVVAAATTLWLKIWTTLASAGRVDSKISRKVIHCGSGPLFMLCWPFFSSHPNARFIAASVPLMQVFALLLSGLKKRQSSEGSKAEGLVAAISRSGKPQEVLRGPFIYVLVLLLATVLYWRENVVGLIAVSQMAAGDGMADIVGRKFGSIKWPFSKDKSYVGSLAFVVAGFVVTLGLMAWFHYWGLIALTPSQALFKVAAISVVCAAVELSPPSPSAWKIPIGDDNVSVPLAASLLAILLFPSSSTNTAGPLLAAALR